MTMIRYSMNDLTSDEAHATGLEHWLKTKSRCFGDKGDVEDITEGRTSMSQFTISSSFLLTCLRLCSGHHIDCGI